MWASYNHKSDDCQLCRLLSVIFFSFPFFHSVGFLLWLQCIHFRNRYYVHVLTFIRFQFVKLPLSLSRSRSGCRRKKVSCKLHVIFTWYEFKIKINFMRSIWHLIKMKPWPNAVLQKLNNNHYYLRQLQTFI